MSHSARALSAPASFNFRPKPVPDTPPRPVVVSQTTPRLLTPNDFYDYQKRAIRHCLENDRNMLWLDMSLGKTAIVLTAAQYNLRNLRAYRVLVIAPRRVAESVWRQEVLKWSHLKNLRVVLLRGTKVEMIRNLHREDVDVHVINYEAIPWLVNQVNSDFLAKRRFPPWNMLVLDEIDRFKNAGGKRYGMLQPMLQYFSIRIGMTGTPADNGYIDLHGQYLAIDDGKRLYPRISTFHSQWCRAAGYGMQSYELLPGAKQEIESRVQDITLSMSAEDYLKLPDYQYHDHWVELPPALQASYDQLENEFFVALDRHKDDVLDSESQDGWTLEVSNAAAARTKCRQFSNGAVIPPDSVGTKAPANLVHDLKLEMLDSIMHEAAGRPVLLAYLYRSDRDRILHRYRQQGYRVAYIGPGVDDQAAQDILEDWNNGRYHLLASHPACLRGDTQVLTEHRGWIRITDVRNDERVFDGVEYVSHDGCSYSGYRPVVDVFGIHMTPNHRLLVNGVWVEAKDVGTYKDAGKEARNTVAGNAGRFSEMREMRACPRNSEAEFSKTQSTWARILYRLRKRHLSQPNINPVLPNVVRHARPVQISIVKGLQKLRWKRHPRLRKMGILREFLRRHVRWVLRLFDYRADRHQRGLRTGELSMGYAFGAAGEQAQQPSVSVPGRGYALGRVMQADGRYQNEATFSTQTGDDARRSGFQRAVLDLRNRKNRCEKAHVYDLVNCGPRHRFLIRNADGEVFISHNSIGHGINAQYGGNEIVWFGLTDNLRYYRQFNARLRRMGQAAPNVHVRRIMTRRTVEEAIAKLLETKTATAEELRLAVEAYRATKERRRLG